MLNFVWLVWVICGTSAWSIQARSVSARDFDAPTPQETSFTLDELGFTQDSVSRSVHIPKDGHLENIALFINGARNHTDPKTYLTTVFPKILRIYRDDEYGYLSIDNRRLCVFKQVLGPAASIDVLLYSREDIDQLLKEEHVKGVELSNSRATSSITHLKPPNSGLLDFTSAYSHFKSSPHAHIKPSSPSSVFSSAPATHVKPFPFPR
ncbi:hypothetical protein ONZ45_g7338 [Pleurotus djamor]|nr:hypothetical protein ONZ45_g7338 [Pleurotus djamor]